MCSHVSREAESGQKKKSFILHNQYMKMWRFLAQMKSGIVSSVAGKKMLTNKD